MGAEGSKGIEGNGAEGAGAVAGGAGGADGDRVGGSSVCSAIRDRSPCGLSAAG